MGFYLALVGVIAKKRTKTRQYLLQLFFGDSPTRRLGLGKIAGSNNISLRSEYASQNNKNSIIGPTRLNSSTIP